MKRWLIVLTLVLAASADPGGKIDPGKTVNAAEAGLVADSEEDQGGTLASIVAAVAADPAKDTVHVPEGRYLITGSIRLLPGVNLVGAGMGRTVFHRDDATDYLVKSGTSGDFKQARVADLSFRNPRRTLLMRDVQHLRFERVEWDGGIVRFENSSQVVMEGCFFNRNLGKAGYAGSECSNMRILHNRFLSVEKGSINLSGHRNSRVAHNHITADKLIDSGYAGIRLPNAAKDNLVEHNYIENHGRGLFVLTYSTGNTLRHNTVRSSRYQGILVQSSGNVIEGNLIMDAGLAALRVSDAHYQEFPSSMAQGNRLLDNRITDTKPATAEAQVGLLIRSSGNTVKGNVVDRRFGRGFMELGEGNEAVGNVQR